MRYSENFQGLFSCQTQEFLKDKNLDEVVLSMASPIYFRLVMFPVFDT